VVLANGRLKCGACDFGGSTELVRLVGVSISLEKNFYQLPFTPPLSGRLIGPSDSTWFGHVPFHCGLTIETILHKQRQLRRLASKDFLVADQSPKSVVVGLAISVLLTSSPLTRISWPRTLHHNVV
jgi:hypothetical protein